jgi:hypothetical protein
MFLIRLVISRVNDYSTTKDPVVVRNIIDMRILIKIWNILEVLLLTAFKLEKYNERNDYLWQTLKYHHN